MGLITLDELETALGRELDEDEEDNAQYLIDTVSAYIETVTDCAFTEGSGSIRQMADYYGELTLSPYPVTEVSSIAAVNYQTSSFVQWDGMQTINGLYPNQVVDITYSYGMSEIPVDIKGVVAEMVKAVIKNLPEGSLKSKQVGDVQHVFDTLANVSFRGLGTTVIQSYSPGPGKTFRLGRGFPNPSGYYP